LAYGRTCCGPGRSQEIPWADPPENGPDSSRTLRTSFQADANAHRPKQARRQRLALFPLKRVGESLAEFLVDGPVVGFRFAKRLVDQQVGDADFEGVAAGP